MYFKFISMANIPYWLQQFGSNFINVGLTRMQKLLKRLGNPEKIIPPVIHVAGTNGKGSTIAFLNSIFSNAGYKVHQYTSPHLLQFNERIVIGNNEITNNQLYPIIEECKLKSEGLNLTFFECTTAAAFLAFATFSADIVFLETGLGGRYDATNVMEDILMSIITPISLDHTEYLGNTLLKIAGEKAGIIKNNSTCVISLQEDEILDYLIHECLRIGSESIAFQKNFSFEKNDYGFKFIDFLRKEEIEFPTPNLKGIHQIINAVTAICAVKNLTNIFKISDNHIKRGIRNVNWPARMQKIENGIFMSLLPINSEIWLDGAHNNIGAQMVAATMETMPKMRTFLINGRTKNKDIDGFLLPFKNKVDLLLAVPIEWEPKSENPIRIKTSAEKIGIRSIECHSLAEAISICSINSNNDAIRIIICGSLYLAGKLNNYITKSMVLHRHAGNSALEQ